MKNRAPVLLLLALGILLHLPTPSVCAWSPQAEAMIFRDALKLSAPDIRTMARKYQADFREGLRDPSVNGADPESLVRAICREARRAVSSIRRLRGFGPAFRSLGLVARQIARLDHPVLANPALPRRWTILPDYNGYIARNIPRFRIVLRNEQESLTSFKDLERFLRSARRRTGRLAELLREAYFVEGVLQSSDSFDPRSVPFGVASISYSSAVNDIANVWLFIWRESGGSVRGAHLIERTTPPEPEQTARDGADS
jgi:hypothetical protein